MQLTLTSPESLLELASRRVADAVERFNAGSVYVMYSGGKDSVASLAASLLAARRRGFRVAAVMVAPVGLTHIDNVVEAREAFIKLCRWLGVECRVVEFVARMAGQARWRIDPEPDTHTLYIVWACHRRTGRDFWWMVRLWGLPGPSERMGAGLRWCEPEMKGWVQRELPSNIRVGCSLGRLLVVGVRRSESWYRARRWPKSEPVTFYNDAGIVDAAIGPIYDMTGFEAWGILRLTPAYSIVRRVYDEWGNAPNCTICPLRSDTRNRKAIARLPLGMLRYIRRCIEIGMARWKPSSFVYRRSMKLLEMIDEETEKRIT